MEKTALYFTEGQTTLPVFKAAVSPWICMQNVPEAPSWLCRVWGRQGLGWELQELAQHPSGVLCLLKLLAEMPDAEVRTV